MTPAGTVPLRVSAQVAKHVGEWLSLKYLPKSNTILDHESTRLLNKLRAFRIGLEISKQSRRKRRLLGGKLEIRLRIEDVKWLARELPQFAWPRVFPFRLVGPIGEFSQSARRAIPGTVGRRRLTRAQIEERLAGGGNIDFGGRHHKRLRSRYRRYVD